MGRTSTALLLAALLVGCGGGSGSGGKRDSGPTPPPVETGWRSVLFPAEWTPETVDDAGRFLHDFSWSGYRNGEAPLPDGAGRSILDVTAFGADPTGGTDSGPAIQDALDAAAAAGGGIVHVPAGRYRCDGFLEIRGRGVVLRGAGPGESRIFFTRHDGIAHRSHLRAKGDLKRGPDILLVADAVSRTHTVRVADVGGLAVGDDVAVGAVITEAFVAEHGMTDVWRAFNGTWQPFFRREVTSIDTSVSPAIVGLDVPLRYPLKVRDGASLRVETGHLEEIGVEEIGLSNAAPWDVAWANSQVHVLEFNGVADGWIRNVHSFEGPDAPAEGPGIGSHLASGGIIVSHSKRVTIAGCRMEAAVHRGGGGNGYLFEIRQSNEILTRDCFARRGRHNYIQNWGFGTTGCVWLRCESRDGQALNDVFGLLVPIPGYCEFHHSLATANLVDSCSLDVGWSAYDRGSQSTGAGHTATENVFWRTGGGGLIRSAQYGHGYIIGTEPGTGVIASDGDWVEGEGKAEDLRPASLYEAQMELRRGAGGD